MVGFDNYIYPGICDVGITTYEVDQAEMAAQAVQVLVKRMNDEPCRYGTHVVEGRLVIKESVQCVKNF